MELISKKARKSTMIDFVEKHAAQIREKHVRKSLLANKGAFHKLERVASVRGVEFINDSRSITLNGSWYALECMVKPTIWIMGEMLDEKDLLPLGNLIDGKVQAIISLTEEGDTRVAALGNYVPIILQEKDLEKAIKKAYALSDRGDVVLFSPGAKARESFRNYKERGNKFIETVRNL